MDEEKKRLAIYNPEADRRWAESNRAHKRYLTYRSTARSFIRNKSTLEDLIELEGLIAERKKVLEE